MAKKKWEIWPLGILIAMLTFMGSIVLAVTIMFNNEVPLVSDDYYKQEIAYQSRIDKETRVADHARQPSMSYLKATDAMEITLPNFQPSARTEGKLTFFRPSNPSKDFILDFVPTDSGTQYIDLSKVDAGLWVVQLDWTEDGESYYYEQKLTL
jgi:hypothetical protein